MTETMLLLLLAYTALVALLVLALISSRWPVVAKLVLVVLASGLYWGSYLGWKDTQGWPASVELPDKFLLHFAVIEEPDDSSGAPGAIFLWLTDLYDDQLAAEPRAYRLPYNQELHARVESAMRRAKAGNLQLGLKAGGDDLPEVKRFRNQLGDRPLELEFVPVPDPSLPEK
ncbi:MULTISPECIES: hypothetical protein [Oceanospirillaceae]|jgi:hypothetical protein|uniref:Uncharacterized protein n=1 Tax=Oceanobacter antarcticus TaxID=3133425 RepID=A0ABW8ND67_9GAMM|tara:strand:+ start:2543 stop:3058 length:516 start_codon:yes stop_codon:yes gene_type:complete